MGEQFGGPLLGCELGLTGKLNGQSDVFQGGQVGDEVEELEDKAKAMVADDGESTCGKVADVVAV